MHFPRISRSSRSSRSSTDSNRSHASPCAAKRVPLSPRPSLQLNHPTTNTPFPFMSADEEPTPRDREDLHAISAKQLHIQMLQNTTTSLRQQHAAVNADFQSAQRKGGAFANAAAAGKDMQRTGQLLTARNRLAARIERYEKQERIAQEELEEMRCRMCLRVEGRRSQGGSATGDGGLNDGDRIHVIPFEALEV